MATATLHEILLNYKAQSNRLNYEIMQLQSQKALSSASMADLNSLKSSEERQTRDYFKNLFRTDEELQEKYTDYTEIPDFEEEIDKITAKFQSEIDELTAWETNIDTQITVADTKLKEIEAFTESYKGMLSSNIQEDFNYGLNK